MAKRIPELNLMYEKSNPPKNLGKITIGEKRNNSNDKL